MNIPSPGNHQRLRSRRHPPDIGYPQPRKKARPWILGGVLLVLLLITGGCVFVAKVAIEIYKEVNGTVDVSYEAGGTGTGSIMYRNEWLNVSQEPDAALPWSRNVTIVGPVDFVSLRVTASADGGHVSCKITVAGTVVAEDHASGRSASAFCAGDPD